MACRLIHRTGRQGQYRFDAFAFKDFADAERFAARLHGDFVIEDNEGIRKYCVSGFEMG